MKKAFTVQKKRTAAVIMIWMMFLCAATGQVTPGNITPAAQTITSGATVSLTHTGSSGVTSRQWQVSNSSGTYWTDIAGATSATYSKVIYNDGSSDLIYKIRVKINGQALYSAETVITVKGSGGSSVTPGSITPATQTVASGSSVLLTHAGSSGVASRQWQMSTNNGSTWTDITGATAATCNTETLTNTGSSNITRRYRVQINGQATYSAEAVITITPAGGSNVTPGSITPATLSVASGSPVTLTHSGSTGVTSRQWQTSYNGTYWTDVANATGVTCNSLVYNTGSSDLVYRIRVKINGQALYSAEAAITVTPAGGSNVTPGSITPATLTVASGSVVTLTHSGSTGVTSRQWQTSYNGTYWTDVANATDVTCNSPIYNTGSSDLVYRIRVKINGQALYSAEAAITVIPVGGSVTSGNITPATQTIASGGSVALTHSGSSGVTSRQWQHSTDNGSTWTDLTTATAATYNTGALTNNGITAITRKYRVKINGQAVYSAESVITVNPPVVAGTVTPATQTITSGGSVALTHSGSSGVTSRLWQQSTDNGSTWTDLTTATAATYNTGALANNGATAITRKYRVKINGQAVYSAESVITVSVPVTVTPGMITPATQAVASGGSVTLTHTGSTGVTSRQWQMSTDNGSTWANISATTTTCNTGALANTGTLTTFRRYRVKINGQAIYSTVSVITVRGSAGGGGNPGSGGDPGGGDPGGGNPGNYPEGTVYYIYDAAGNRVVRNQVINMTTTASLTKSSVGETTPEEMEETEEVAVTETPKFEEILTETKIVIYPNPTQGMLQIDITGGEISKDAKIHIYNQSGNLVRQINSVSGSNVMDISSQPSGIYILRITLNKDRVSVWKVIKD